MSSNLAFVSLAQCGASPNQTSDYSTTEHNGAPVFVAEIKPWVIEQFLIKVNSIHLDITHLFLYTTKKDKTPEKNDNKYRQSHH